MKAIVIAAGALFAGAAATASAQVYYERAYTTDPYARAEIRAGDECWNPGAGHYEGVRPGEVQNDLDFSRCRPMGGRYSERRYQRGDWRDNQRGDWRDNPRGNWRDNARQECWNPRAGHYENVRPGEFQGDLDLGRCRISRY